MLRRISFFDTSSRLTGFCTGTGEDLPKAGAFPLPAVGEDFGQLADLFSRHINRHIDEYQPDVIGFETPILTHTDTPETLRKLYGVAFVLEMIATQRGIEAYERGHKQLKMALTGSGKADKPEMAAAAVACGIKLPATKEKGRFDAADAFAGWLIGLHEYNPSRSSQWDRLVMSKGRGRLV